MTRPYSIASKQKMIEQLTGKYAVSANRLANETGIRQENLSRWLREARNLPLMESNKQVVCTWTVEQKARLLADASMLTGKALEMTDLHRLRINLQLDETTDKLLPYFLEHLGLKRAS